MPAPLSRRRLEWTNLSLGAGLFISAFLLGDFPQAALSSAITGLLIVTCSMLSLYRFNRSAEWFNMALGGWTLVAPFILGFGSHPAALSIHLLIGLCVVTISGMQRNGIRNAALAEAKLPVRRRR